MTRLLCAILILSALSLCGREQWEARILSMSQWKQDLHISGGQGQNYGIEYEGEGFCVSRMIGDKFSLSVGYGKMGGEFNEVGGSYVLSVPAFGLNPGDSFGFHHHYKFSDADRYEVDLSYQLIEFEKWRLSAGFSYGYLDGEIDRIAVRGFGSRRFPVATDFAVEEREVSLSISRGFSVRDWSFEPTIIGYWHDLELETEVPIARGGSRNGTNAEDFGLGLGLLVGWHRLAVSVEGTFHHRERISVSVGYRF